MASRPGATAVEVWTISAHAAFWREMGSSLPPDIVRPPRPKEAIDRLEAGYTRLCSDHPRVHGVTVGRLPTPPPRPRANLRRLRRRLKRTNRIATRLGVKPLDLAALETLPLPTWARRAANAAASSATLPSRARALLTRASERVARGTFRLKPMLRGGAPGSARGRPSGDTTSSTRSSLPGRDAQPRHSKTGLAETPSSGPPPRWRVRLHARLRWRAWPRWLRYLAGASAISLVVIVVTGLDLAGDALEAGHAKTAIAVHVEDPDLHGAPIGYLFGPIAGKDEDVYGADRSVPVPPSELEPGGHLYYWYQALMVLEDKQHDGGFSDWIGVHSRMPFAIVRSALAGRLEGASSIADQTCGALRAELDKYAETSRAWKKLEETLCGVGLAQLRNPREIAALYGTHGYLAPMAQGIELFVRLYWGFADGVTDSRLNIGRQLVLASMLRYTWTSTSRRWDLIRSRAYYALEQLIEEGLIPEDQEAHVKQQIDGCQPRSHESVREAIRKRGSFLTFPRLGYEAALHLARREMSKYLGDHWGTEVRRLWLTIDPNVQGTAYRRSMRALRQLHNEAARSLAAVVDGRGRIIAWHTGDAHGADQVDRMHATYSPGSLGKLLLAAAVSDFDVDLSRHESQFKAFSEHLRWSKTAIIDDAKALGVDGLEVKALIECYGALHPGARDYFEDAALGIYSSSPYKMLRMLYEARYGMSMPGAHVVLRYEQANGNEVEIEGGRRTSKLGSLFTSDGARARICAARAHRNGRTWPLLKLPLGGTLRGLRGYVDAGKTGTVGPVETRDKAHGTRGNNMAWTLAARAFEGNTGGGFYTILVGIGADDRKTLIPTLGAGGKAAGPVVRDIVVTLEQRKKEGKL